LTFIVYFPLVFLFRIVLKKVLINPLDPPFLGEIRRELGGHPQAPAKGAKPFVESPIETGGESREAGPLWWGSGGIPRSTSTPFSCRRRGPGG
jgi:hypothetical protein